VLDHHFPTIRRRGAHRRTRRAGAAGLALLALLGAGVAESGDHRVAPGETLSGIAASYGTSTGALAAANGITDPNHIVVGTRLVIPGSTGGGGGGAVAAASHQVAVGETLSEIAARYGITVGELAEANAITDRNHIVVGTNLEVAGGASSGGASSGGASTSASRATAAADAPGVPSFVPPARRHLAASFGRWAAEYGVPVDLLMALAWHESGWQTDVVSTAQATGVMQIIPATAHFTSVVLLGLDDTLPVTDPDANIRMGARFLAYLLDQFEGDEVLALAAYNQGLTSVRRQGPQDAILVYVDIVQAQRDRF
jgi:N-acetylmuramoyl-L-alanine amidase